MSLPADVGAAYGVDMGQDRLIERPSEGTATAAKLLDPSQSDLRLTEEEGLVPEVLVPDRVAPFHHLVQELASSPVLRV